MACFVLIFDQIWLHFDSLEHPESFKREGWPLIRWTPILGKFVFPIGYPSKTDFWSILGIPRRLQDGSRRLKTAPKRCQDASKTAQDASGHFQDFVTLGTLGPLDRPSVSPTVRPSVRSFVEGRSRTSLEHLAMVAPSPAAGQGALEPSVFNK